MKTSSLPAFAAIRLLGCATLLLASSARAVLVADNGFGTAQMPVAAPYLTETPMNIVDGLPAFTTINIDGIFHIPGTSAEIPGGSLGGTKSGGANVFQWTMQGSGALSGFNRVINMPLSGNVGTEPALGSVGFEIHAAPRTPLAPLQYFNTDMFRMFSQITGDPDFDLLRLVAGTDFGLPSPGQTSFSQSGLNWDAGSFFDLTYRIDFVGRAGGALTGRSGSTTGTVRISLGTVVPEPSAALLTGALALLCCGRRRRRGGE